MRTQDFNNGKDMREEEIKLKWPYNTMNGYDGIG
jgi:hypothetical protein